MFNRQKTTKDNSDATTPEGSWRSEMQRRPVDESPVAASTTPDTPAQVAPASPPAPGSPSAKPKAPKAPAAVQVHEMLERLDSMGLDDGDSTSGKLSVAAELTTHGDTLRAAVEAQQNAQRILELATKERADATTQSEQILLEAKAMSARLQKEAKADSDRVHKETKAWAADQRSAIKALVADVKAAATAESEKVRSEALDRAREEAEAFGVKERARHREAAERDAAATRDRARAMLQRSQSQLGDIQAAVALLGETMDGFVTQLREQATALDETLKDPELLDLADSPTQVDEEDEEAGSEPEVEVDSTDEPKDQPEDESSEAKDDK